MSDRARIMVVDDSWTARARVARVLEPLGYQIVQAEDGADALAKLGASGGDVRLIFCDMSMPRMNGIEFLRTVRMTSFSRVPVVMLSTESHPDALAQARSLGARDFIQKPFASDAIVAAAAMAREGT